MPDATTQVHRPFFAVRPDAQAQAVAIGLAQQLGAEHGLTGKPIPMDRQHVTLHWLQDHTSLSPELVAAAMAAGAGVDMAPFDVVFDRVQSLGDASHGGPLVLTGAAGLAALRRFQRVLAAGMTDAGIGRYVRSRFKPHLTLRYDHQYVAPQPIRPIRWTVSELVLIDSLVGKSQHIVLGRWPLQSRQMGF